VHELCSRLQFRFAHKYYFSRANLFESDMLNSISLLDLAASKGHIQGAEKFWHLTRSSGGPAQLVRKRASSQLRSGQS